MGSQLPANLVEQILAGQQQDVDPILEERKRANEAARLAALQNQTTIGAGPRALNIPNIPTPSLGTGPWGVGGGGQQPPSPGAPLPLDPRSEQEKFQSQIATQTRQTQGQYPQPQPPQPMGPSPEQLQAVARQRAAGTTPAGQARQQEAKANIGPGAREFAPGQFYSGPDRVTGTARADNFSGNAGTASLPPASSGRGTLSMMQPQEKEIMPSDPRLRRQAELQKAQQEAALSGTQTQKAAADAQRQIIEQGGQPEQKSTKDTLAEFFIMQGQRQMEEANRALQAGQITPEQHEAQMQEVDNSLMQVFQIINRFSPDQLQLFSGPQVQPEG